MRIQTPNLQVSQVNSILLWNLQETYLFSLHASDKCVLLNWVMNLKMNFVKFLPQWFSNFNVQMHHLRILVKGWIWSNKSRVKPEILHFQQQQQILRFCRHCWVSYNSILTLTIGRSPRPHRWRLSCTTLPHFRPPIPNLSLLSVLLINKL